MGRPSRAAGRMLAGRGGVGCVMRHFRSNSSAQSCSPRVRRPEVVDLQITETFIIPITVVTADIMEGWGSHTLV